MTYYASFQMGGWCERQYGKATTNHQLWVSEWSGVVCGLLDTSPIVSICPMNFGGVNICGKECQLIPYRYME